MRIVKRREELKSMLHYNKKESKIFMPNEIFDDLQNEIEDGTHVSFSYSYIYLCTWLYRHTKHFNPNTYDNNIIKQVLGYDKSNRTLNYLIKKNGLLDEIGYLESVRDFPISWEIVDGELHFDMYSDYPEFPAKMSNRFFLKKPVFAFERVDLDDSNYIMEGTFYNITNTHMIPFEVFLFCMSKKELGVSAFYLYSYLKYKCDYFGEGYDVSLNRLTEETGMSRMTLSRTLSSLREYGMVEAIHNQEFFALAMDVSERKANTYIAKDHTQFSDEKVEYERIKVMKKAEYWKLKETEKEEMNKLLNKKKVDIQLSELPF